MSGWTAAVAILLIRGVVSFLAGFGRAIGALVMLSVFYVFPLDDGAAAGTADAAKTDACREEWLGRRAARRRESAPDDPDAWLPAFGSPSGRGAPDAVPGGFSRRRSARREERGDADGADQKQRVDQPR